jgi:DNA-binding response OmpR family regulator
VIPNILVVDDEPGIVQFVRGVLEDEGFAVTAAGDGRRAVELAAERAPDLVILDMSLPRLDGAEVAAELRRLHGDGVRILLITADGRASEKARQVGALDYLAKPFDLSHLIDKVQAALAT